MEVQRLEPNDKQSPNELLQDEELPQCKIKRNYSCNHCTYFTQNPRFYLTHLRDIHGERIVINKCNLCLYASRHYQKLVRHMKMVHGSTEGITGQPRKRPPAEDTTWNQLQKKIPIPPSPLILFPVESVTDFTNLPNDLELSRKSLKDIAALYFAENQIDTIMTQMEKADAVQLPPPPSSNSPVAIKRKAFGGSSFFDKLKKSFFEEENLICICGHVSKCFSESLIHRKSCNNLNKNKDTDEVPSVNLSSGSTRCQQCRRRCKSSVDLLRHLKNCSKTERLRNESLNSISDVNSNGDGDGCNLMDNQVSLCDKDGTPSGGMVLENNVDVNVDIKANQDSPKNADGESLENKSYCSAKTSKVAALLTSIIIPEEEVTSSSLKKVFKCPCCSFWASTASRFHVHIVGHLNKKPFKCSLCAYRSNWRWDITKHIRIKTIRNPNHKNARVIMSDETGRRNYTKYNKYITLMKVSDEDGDPKLIRSGEMTPNQEASLAFLNDFKKEATESEKLNQNKDTTDSTSMLFKQTEHQSQLESKHSTPALIRLTDDLITDSTSEGLEKKTFYNCRKCYFRHANRDAVLAHVKIHHQDAGCLPLPPKSNLNSPLQAGVNSKIFYMNKDFAAALFLSPKQPVQEQKLHNDSNNNQHSILLQCGGVPSPASSPPRQGKPSKETVEPLYLGGTNIQHNEATETTSSITATSNPTASTTIFNSPTTSTTNGASSFIDDASKSAIILGVTTNTNFDTDANERKEPSPFRCGHCHQVSNWKHVIQRHCRLKHSGQIQIEAFDRSSDGSAPIYRPLDFDGNNQSRRLLGSSANVLKARQPYMPHTLSNSDSELSKNENNSLDSSVSSCNSDSEIIRLPLKSSSTIKQQKCPSCPFVSKDKLQLNFHISLHKSMQYKCNQCSYICNKKQYLSSHFKTHSKPAPNDLKEAMESSADEKPPAVVAVKVVSYCPRCPERFVNNSINLQQHLMAHCADLDFKCDICDFSTERKDILLSHSFVHTSTYQEKAEQIAKDSKEDSDYPAQKLQQIILQKDGATAWVIAENFTKSHDDEEFLPNEQLKSGSSKDSGTSTSSPGVLEKCPYCPFHSVCQKSIQHHLQYHINVSKRPEKHTCEHCDFSTSSRANLAEHTRIHFKAIDRRKSVSFLTSLDNLELIVTDSDENEDEEHRPTNTVLKSDSKVVKRCGKIEKETSSNMRRIRRSSAFKNEKKSSQPPSSHKTILVNPKTGQVIKRN